MAQRLNKKLVVGLTVTTMVVIAGAGILLVYNLPGRDPKPAVDQAEKLVAQAGEIEGKIKAIDDKLGELADEAQKSPLREERSKLETQLQETYTQASKYYVKAFNRAVSAGDTASAADYMIKAGDLAYKTGDPRPAMDCWHRVLLNDPKNEPAQEKIVGVLLEFSQMYKGGWNELRKEAEKLVAEDFAPNNAVGLNALGRALTESTSSTLDDLKKGGDYLKKAFHLRNTSPDFADSLALYHLRLLDREIAEARGQSRPDQMAVLEAKRDQAIKAGLGEYEILMNALAKAPQQDKSATTLAWRKQAQFHMVARNAGQAELQGRMQSRVAQTDIEAIRARIAEHSKAALECLNKALASSPQDVDSLVLLGVYWRTSMSQATEAASREQENDANYLKAKEVFEKAIKADPDSFDPYLELHQFYLRQAERAYSKHDKDGLVSSVGKANQVLEERIKRGAARTGLRQGQNMRYMGLIRWQLFASNTLQIERLRALAGSVATAKAETAPIVAQLRQIRQDFVAESSQGDKAPPAMFMKARIEMLDGDSTAAIRSFSEVQDLLSPTEMWELWLQTKMYLAQLYLLIDAPGEAEKPLQAVVKVLPSYDPAMGMLAQALSVLPGREGDAEGAAKRALAVNPSNNEALNALARVYEKQKNWKELERIQAAVRTGKSDTQADLLEASLLLTRGNDSDHTDPDLITQAEGKLRTILQAEPSNLQALRMLLSILTKSPDNQKEVAALLAKASADVDAKMKPAGATQPAERDMRQLQSLKSNIAFLGILADPNTKVEERIAKTEQLIRQNSDPFMMEVDLYRLCFGMPERKPEAIQHLKKAYELKPDDPGVVEMMFRTAISSVKDKDGKEVVKPDWALAEKLVSRAVEVKIDRTQGHYYRGQMLFAHTDLKDNFVQAEKELRESLKILPVHSNGYAWLGRSLYAQNRLEEAQAAYQQAMAQNPRNAMAAYELARVAAARGDNEMKAKYVKVCQELKIQEPWIQEQAQQAQDEADPQAGIARREEIRKNNPKELNNLFALAALYERANQRDKAKAVMAECYALQPKDLGFVQMYANFLRGLNPPDYQTAEAVLSKTFESIGPDEKDAKATAQLLRAAHMETLAARAVPNAPKQEEIEAAFAKAAEISPTPSVLSDVAAHYRRVGQLAKCEEWLRKSVAKAEADKNTLVEKDSRRTLLDLMLDQKDSNRSADIQKEIEAYRAKFDDPFGLLAMSELSSILGRETSAIDYATRYINATSEFEKALGFFRRGSMNYRRGDWDLAINDLREAKSLAPNGFNYEPRILLARCLQITGQTDQAISELTAILGDNRMQLQAAEELYNVYMAAKRYDEAEAFIMPAYQRDPKSPQWIGLLAKVAAKRGDQKRALDRGVETVQNAQYAPSVLDSLLSFYMDFGQFKEMLQYVQTQLPEAHRGNVLVQARLAIAHLAVGDVDKASQAYARAMAETGPAAADVLGCVLEMPRRMDKDKALKFMRDEAAKHPDNVLAAVVAAHALRLAGDEESYANALNQLLAKLTANTPEAKVLRIQVLQGLSGSYQQRNQFEAARKAYEQLLENVPEPSGARAVALNNLAYLLMENLTQPAVALPYAEEAARMMPTQTNVLDTLGWNLILLGQYDRGVATVRRAIYEASAQDLVQFAAVHYHAAVGLQKRSVQSRQQGQTAQADQDVTEATLDCRRAYELLTRAHDFLFATSDSPDKAQRAWAASDGAGTVAKIVALGKEIGLTLDAKLPAAKTGTRPQG